MSSIITQPFILIGMGKCGYATLTTEFTKHKIPHVPTHASQTIYQPGKKYVLLIRNPIQRFVSAFNWRYHLLSNKLISERPYELAGLEKYKPVNNIAEKLYNSDGTLNDEIHTFITHKYITDIPAHFGLGVDFYIGDFVNKYSPEDLLGVVTTEHIRDDVKRLFGIELTEHQHKNAGNYDTYLSERAYANLRKYLKPGYDCIDKLYANGSISQIQYHSLSS